MKEFINKHPLITAGIIFGFYATATRIVSLVVGKEMVSEMIFIEKIKKVEDDENNKECKEYKEDKQDRTEKENQEV